MSTGDVLWCMFVAFGFGLITAHMLTSRYVTKLRDELAPNPTESQPAPAEPPQAGQPTINLLSPDPNRRRWWQRKPSLSYNQAMAGNIWDIGPVKGVKLTGPLRAPEALRPRGQQAPANAPVVPKANGKPKPPPPRHLQPVLIQIPITYIDPEFQNQIIKAAEALKQTDSTQNGETP